MVIIPLIRRTHIIHDASDHENMKRHRNALLHRVLSITVRVIHVGIFVYLIENQLSISQISTNRNENPTCPSIHRRFVLPPILPESIRSVVKRWI